MNIPYVFKRCSKCGRWLVASSVNFHKAKTGKYGLKAECKECKKKYYQANKETFAERQRQHYQENKEVIVERQRQYYQTNKEVIVERHRQYYQENKEVIVERHRQYRQANKEAIAEQKRQYRQANKEAIAEHMRQYYKINKEAIAEYHKKWYGENKESEAERKKKYHKTPQGQVVAFNIRNRRRAKEQNQGNGITKEQWLEMMNFFGWRCAYSGKTLTKETRSIDHIDPLNHGGENEIWNCIPMDRSLNSSKNDKEMLDWYIKQPFCTAERLLKIYNWQEYAKKKYDNSIVNE